MKHLTKIIYVFLSYAWISSLYATEINMTGKNIYVQNKNQNYYQICFENTDREKKININDVVDSEVCVNVNPKLEFTVVNVMPEKNNENFDFNIKIKEKIKNNISGLSKIIISSFYLGDIEDNGDVMQLNYDDLCTDTVITSPDFRDASSKIFINNYMMDKYVNI